MRWLFLTCAALAWFGSNNFASGQTAGRVRQFRHGRFVQLGNDWIRQRSDRRQSCRRFAVRHGSGRRSTCRVQRRPVARLPREARTQLSTKIKNRSTGIVAT